VTCAPVDYASIAPGASVKQVIELGGGQRAECNLCVLPTLPRNTTHAPGGGGGVSGPNSRAARFFVNGRRIASCGGTPSFAKLSPNRWTVWSHPQVVGYIDVVGHKGGPLQPVITRDEFKNKRGRTAAFDAIIAACEAPLEHAIESANERVSEKSLSKLEDTLTQVLAAVADEERREASAREKQEKAVQRRRRREAIAERKAAAEVEAAAAAEEASKPFTELMAGAFNEALIKGLDTAAKALDPSISEAEAAEEAAKLEAAKAEAAAERERKRQERRMRRTGPASEEFTVRLVRGFGDAEGGEDGADGEAPAAARERSRLVGSMILVDSLHPDFLQRWRQTRQGTPKVDERLCGYLATIVSSHYRERAYQAADKSRIDYAQAYEEMIATYCRLEEGLRAVLPSLLREMEDQRRGGGGGDEFSP
jgi:hypothetical protein